MRRRFGLLPSSIVLGGLAAVALGVAGVDRAAPDSALADYRPIDNTITAQVHDHGEYTFDDRGSFGLVRNELLQQAGATTSVQVLGFNDFHGNLEPPSGSGGRVVTAAGPVDAGGAAYLSTHLDTLRARNANTTVVSAGDMIGASPFLSALFHDEPSIKAMDEVGVEYNAVGNHEFDEGLTELLRMQNGGCHPVDGCDAGPFNGADFQFLAANVLYEDTGEPIFPAYGIAEFGDVKVGFIGVVTRTTPTIVSASGIVGLEFIDEAEAVNGVVPELQAMGVETIIVVIHEGGQNTGTYNECTGLNGPITDIVDRMDEAVDAIISGHSHIGYNCEYKGRLLTQAASGGRLVTSLDLTIDNASGEVVEMFAENHIVTRDVTPDPAISAIIAQYKTAAGPIGARVVGTIAATIPNVSAPSGENRLGNLIADAQLAATADEDTGEAVIAFMNPGGIRADLIAEANGSVTYEKAFVTQPFNNYLVTLTLTGAQIDTLLEQQWAGQTFPRILQISDGFTYTWDGSKPDGQKVDIASIKLNGAAISATATYRVTVNSFLADGGDNFVVLRQGTNRLVGGLDIDALEDYLTENAPVPTPPLGRITAQNIPVPTPTPAPATPTAVPATPTIAQATATSVPATSIPATPTRSIPMPPNTGEGTEDRGFGRMDIALIIAGLLAVATGVSLLAVSNRSLRS